MSKYRAIPEYYDAEFAHLDILEKDVPFLLSRMPKRSQSVLELAAGTGRAAIPLGQAGHRVVGVDYDEAMLAIGRRKCAVAGLTDRQVKLVRGDCLKLRVGTRFDWVVCLFNTFLNFTTLEQQDAVLRNVVGQLKPGGRFYLDIYHPSLELLAQGYSSELDPICFHVPELDRTVFRTTELRPTSDALTQELIYHYVWYEKGLARQRKNRFYLTNLFPRELRLLLERNGLRVEGMWGDYDGSEVTPESSRILTLCRRA